MCARVPIYSEALIILKIKLKMICQNIQGKLNGKLDYSFRGLVGHLYKNVFQLLTNFQMINKISLLHFEFFFIFCSADNCQKVFVVAFKESHFDLLLQEILRISTNFCKFLDSSCNSFWEKKKDLCGVVKIA